MAKVCEISIVIPVFNEAENFPELLGKIRALGLSNVEIIVVDDGSTDGSAEIAMEAGANVIRHSYNIGNGAAIKSGIRTAVFSSMQRAVDVKPRLKIGRTPET